MNNNILENYIILKNVKIFDRNNPNFVIPNTDDEIKALINNKNIPIIENELPVQYDDDGNPKEIIIGFVKNITEIKDNIFYGNVFLWDDRYANYSFCNYEVQVDKNNSITNIVAVQFK